MDPKEAERTLESVLGRLPTGIAADARLEQGSSTTMRFANGAIHQPHREELSELSLRIADARRLGTVTTMDLSPHGLSRAVAEGLALARSAPEEPKFPGFPDGGTVRPRTPYSRATARLTPEAVAAHAQRLLDGARRDLPEGRISGVVHQGDLLRTVANTRGRLAQTRQSVLAMRVLVEDLAPDPPASGWAEAAHWDGRRLDGVRLGREASARVARAPAVSLPPGKYRVLLDGSAAAKLVDEFVSLGFSARGAEEGWSCLAGRWGRRIAPPGLTILDDGLSPEGLPVGIDWEGTPKRRTRLVDRGISGGPALDLLTAARMGKRPTGHALPPEAPLGGLGALPLQVQVRPGAARSLEELIRETGRGVLVTRLHYVRTVHAGKGIITGMTRDGTYRIERGEIVAPLRNLRFTESVLTALRAAELWGRERRCFAGDDERGLSAVTAPALLTSSFRFTSATVF